MLEQKGRQYSLEEVLSKVAFSSRKIKCDFDGDPITMSIEKLKLFALKGVTCADCGVVGEFFLKERIPNASNYSFTLYAEKDGHYVEMTKDHIIPKSEGGRDCLDNYRPMCKSCNHKRGVIGLLQFSKDRALKEIESNVDEFKINGVSLLKEGNHWVVSKNGKLLDRKCEWVPNRIPVAMRARDAGYLSEVRFPFLHALKLVTVIMPQHTAGKKLHRNDRLFGPIRLLSKFVMGIKNGR